MIENLIFLFMFGFCLALAMGIAVLGGMTFIGIVYFVLAVVEELILFVQDLLEKKR